VASQAGIREVGWVDFLIDGWLIVEIDSRRHHDDPRSQHRDRVRDGNAVLQGYGNLRFDYHLVQNRLDWCLQVVQARLAAGRPRGIA
jgi:very-short-patch-repair endonuclease